MPLIKSSKASVSQLQPFSMKDIEHQAQAIMARARQQSDQLLAAAKTTLTQVATQSRAAAQVAKATAHADGHATGHAAGLAAGYAQGLEKGLTEGREQGLRTGREEAYAEHGQKLVTVFQTLSGLAGDFDSHRCKLELDALKDVIDLAVAIGQRVTKRMGEVDPAVAVANVREALKLVGAATDIRLAIAPGQKAMMEAVLPELRLEWPHLEHVILVEDPTLIPGGCRVFSDRGQIDADLDSQLRRVVADLVPDNQEAMA